MKVLCINNKPIFSDNVFNDSLKKLKEGVAYTVIGSTTTGYLLREVKSSHPDGGYNASRFIPCSEIDEMEHITEHQTETV